MSTVFQAGSRVRVDVLNGIDGIDGKSAAQQAFEAGLINEPTALAFDARTRDIAAEEVAAEIASGPLTVIRVPSDVVISTAGLSTFLTSPALKADTSYVIDARIIFRSSATTNGIGFSFAFLAAQLTSFAATWSINTSQSGTVAPSISTQRAANTVANTVSVDVANADMLATATGLFSSSLAGAALIARARTENDPAASTVTIRAGSVVMLREVV